ncbi:BnaC05g18980D [Brassica napus]|uniref:BnaC05g18980D protein n=1 Tax=Brassica napus TaxID=3708 RepID=A0A078IBZ7_BRANA|nr:BnaC05g18980D [Brassica napus]
MEMKIDEKLSVMELLKRAVKLIFSNINHAFFLFLCSLPLFCFLIFSKLSLQTTISLAYQFPSHNQINLPENDLITWLIQTSLLYFFPYSLLDLFTTTMIVAASSTSEEKPLGMLSLVRRSAKICQNRLVGCLITSLYVLLS